MATPAGIQSDRIANDVAITRVDLDRLEVGKGNHPARAEVGTVSAVQNELAELLNRHEVSLGGNVKAVDVADKLRHPLKPVFDERFELTP